MSSTERAPEPTMEDILASIRRIITDDETDKGQADKSATAAQTEDAGLEGEADNQIIDDIARVLSSGGDEPANEDEEIMDLTGELGGLELVEDEPEPLAEAPEVVEAAPEFVDSTEATEELLELDSSEPDALEPDVLEPDVLEPDVLAPDTVEAELEVVEVVETMELAEVVETAEVELQPEAVAEEVFEPEMPPMAPPPIPEPVAEAAPEAPKLSASEEAATALERAIAALKAGQSPSAATAPIPPAAPVPSFEAPAPGGFDAAAELSTAVEPELAYDPAGEASLPDEMPMAVPMESPTPEAETHLDPDAESVLEMAEIAPDGDAEVLAEDELVLMDAETEETIVLEDAEPESAPFWPPQNTEEPAVEPEIAPEPVFAPAAIEVAAAAVASEALASEAPAADTNGAVSHETPGSKSLEDSIKEMLRPMLREWLNENMPRMIREELDSDALQRGQD